MEEKIQQKEVFELDEKIKEVERRLDKDQKDEFADGLAEWDIMPPQIMVRRVKRKL